MGCVELRESRGQRADSERHLMERIETAPADSVYCHSVRSLLRQVDPDIHILLLPDDEMLRLHAA